MVTAEKGRRCDFCGGEFIYPDTISRRRDIRGGFIRIPGKPYLPFKCPHCGGLFCVDHRLPEKHNCAHIVELKLQKSRPWKHEVGASSSEEIRKTEKVGHTHEEARASSGLVRKKEEKEDKWSEEKFYNQVGLNGPQKWGEGLRNRKTRRVHASLLIKILKVIAFSAYTVLTIMPIFFNIYVLFNYPKIISLYWIFSPYTLLAYIIVILFYPTFWLYAVNKIVRKRGVWWYHLLLLIISLANVWVFMMLARASGFASALAPLL